MDLDYFYNRFKENSELNADLLGTSLCLQESI